MKRHARTSVLVACAVALTALVMAYQGSAQEPAPAPPAATEPDLGQTDLLLLTCAFVKTRAAEQGVTVQRCRRHAPEQINGYEARVTVKIFTDAGRYVLEVDFRKSLWWVDTWNVTLVS